MANELVKNKSQKYKVMNHPIRWHASEYNQVTKSAGWYFMFAVIVTAMILFDIIYLKSQLATFSILVVVMAVSLIVYSMRPAKELPYTLSADQGLYIAETLHPFSEFRSFGVIKDANKSYIGLIPIKRFSPMLSIYYPQELGDEITDILSSKLPLQELKIDLLDRLIRLLRI